MSQVVLNYTAAQIEAAIQKINSLIVYPVYVTDVSIVQLVDVSNIFPLTKAEAVFFNNDVTKDLAFEFSQLEQRVTALENIINASSE